MSWIGDLAKQGAEKAADFLVDNIKKAIAAGVLAIVTAAGLYVWKHFNPTFQYAATPSSTGSHFVGLAQVLNQIEKDSHVYCSGGWDQRLAWLGWRTCYHFTFNPNAIYRLYVCSHGERSVEISTSDQLLALQTFERAYAPLACFKVSPKGANAYEIAQEKDLTFRPMSFANQPAEPTAFCGCSDQEQREIASTIGATLP